MDHNTRNECQRVHATLRRASVRLSELLATGDEADLDAIETMASAQLYVDCAADDLTDLFEAADGVEVKAQR